MEKRKYRKADSEIEIILKEINPGGLIIADIGCGIGNLTRGLAGKKAQRVFGIDIEEIIAKAEKQQDSGNEIYLAGRGEKLPLSNEIADCVIYFASFHHIPANKMRKALKECYRVLKYGGVSIMVEPVFEKGCYCELAKLRKDEKQVQKEAYKIIKKAGEFGLQELSEKFYYIMRTYDDFRNLICTYVEGEKKQLSIFKKAAEIINSVKGEKTLLNQLFKSTIRVNVFKKS